MLSPFPAQSPWYPKFGSLVLVAALFTSCGESEVNQAHYEGGDPLARLDPDAVQSIEGEYSLVVVGGAAGAQTGQTVALSVALTDSAGAMIAEERVRFELVSTPDDSSSLAASNAVTAADGTASVDLRTGAAGGEIVIRATHDAAAPLELSVSIEQIDTGTLRVEFLEPTATPGDLGPYRVSVFPGAQMDCSTYNAKASRPATVAQEDVATRTGAANFVLPAGETYSVVVDALGAGGRPLADGCADGLSVAFQGNTAAIVNLSLIPLEVAGTYQVAGTWDFSAALAGSGTAGSATVQLIDFMANPGEAVYDMIMTELDDVLSFSLSFLFSFSGLDTVIADYINQQIYRFVDISTFVAISNDMKTMLHELEVESELVIEKTQSDYSFHGYESWKRVKIAWSWQCQNSGAADCGEYVIDVDGAGQLPGLGAVSYDWAGRVENHADLVVESHAVSLNYNALMLFVLENAIIPGVTGGNANSLGEALAYWIDCGQLAQQVIGNNDICDPTGFFCVGETTLNLACEAGLPALVNRLIDPLLDNSSNVDVSLDGTALLRDLDGNGTVDEIDKGETLGTVAGSTAPMTVDWTGVYGGL